MPEFVATLLAAAVLCLALLALSRILLQACLAIRDLGGSGFPQIGGALAPARVACRRAPHRWPN